LSKTWSPAKTLVVPDTRETTSSGEIILGIRKPDLLGEAMWQFSHGKVNISASISDEEWLRKFHEQEIALYSGDSMRCRVLFTYVYDEDGGLLEQKTEVIKVLEIIRSGGSQGGFQFDRT
jgi:hypothetical protein